MRSTSTFLTALVFAGCTATSTPTHTPDAGSAADAGFTPDATAEVPDSSVPTCSAATPVCEPSCGVGSSCTYQNGAGGCVAVVTCQSDAPTCEGNGPNNGCARGGG